MARQIIEQVRADVKCYHCGHVLGELQVEPGRPLASGTFVPGPNCTSRAPTPVQLRCDRCGGPIFFDELQTVKIRREPPFQFRERQWRRRSKEPVSA